MGLYRQIAGNQVGLSFIDNFLHTGFPGMTPVDYSSPIQTLTPSSPVSVTDTGAVSPIRDPRDWSPIDLGPSALTPTFPTLEVPTASNPLQPTGLTDQGQTSTPLPASTQTAITNNILPLAALAGVILVAVKGIDLLGDKRKIALLGGLGLLYYGMAKNKLV